MPDFQFQSFELFPAASEQNGPPQARGEFRIGDQKIAADVRESDGFLWFNFRDGDPEWNFLAASMHSARTHAPRRAFEKLGQGQTLILLVRRALGLGFWGRLFFLSDAQSQKFALFLGEGGRHLLVSTRDLRRNSRAEWTPLEWDLKPEWIQIPASQLFRTVQSEWDNPRSGLNRVKNWSESDYFERLWDCLEFEIGNAPLLRRILGAAASLIAPDDGARGWILRFQLPERGEEIDLYERLFEERGARQVPLSDAAFANLGELLAAFAPRRRRASGAHFLAQREWLESNSGVGNWSLSIEARALSAHEKLETALELRRDLQEIWPQDRARDWMAPFLATENTKKAAE